MQGDKFDFVLIPVESELYVDVLNEAGVLSSLFGNKEVRRYRPTTTT